MGPSIGWIVVPFNSVLPVMVGGTTTVLRSTNVVLVYFTGGGVVIQLPSSRRSPAGNAVVPGLANNIPITIIDQGGNAFTNNINILPFGAELIDGLASVQIAADFGALTLRPILEAPGGWTLTQ